MAKCTVSDNGSGQLGKYEFEGIPRVGETVAIQTEKGKPHKNYTVTRVSHRTAGPEFSSETFVFVDEEL